MAYSGAYSGMRFVMAAVGATYLIPVDATKNRSSSYPLTSLGAAYQAAMHGLHLLVMKTITVLTALSKSEGVVEDEIASIDCRNRYGKTEALARKQIKATEVIAWKVTAQIRERALGDENDIVRMPAGHKSSKRTVLGTALEAKKPLL